MAIHIPFTSVKGALASAKSAIAGGAHGATSSVNPFSGPTRWRLSIAALTIVLWCFLAAGLAQAKQFPSSPRAASSGERARVATASNACNVVVGGLAIIVEFTNESGSTLTLKGVEGVEGEFLCAPPQTIAAGEKVAIVSVPNEFLHGTEFTFVYELENHSQMRATYEDPFFEDNSHREQSPPGFGFETSFNEEGELADFVVSFSPVCECDGIPDKWKRQGVTIDPNTGKPVPNGTPGGQFIDLPHMGVSLNRPNVLVQMDWMEDKTHNQKLRQSAIDKVIQAYSNSPVTYPGATRPGVTLIVDAGPDSTISPGGEKWGTLSQAKAIPWKENFTTGKRSGINFTPYEELLKNNFVPTGRKPIFHYDTVVAALSAESEGTSGWTPSGAGSIISLGDWTGGVGSEGEQAGTFMHENGHVLGLSHGGEDSINFKPNYPSVMNYFYQTGGVPRNGQYVYDYSREPAEPNIDETTLSEKGGISLGANLQKYGVTWWCPKRAGTRATFLFGAMDLNCDGITPDGGTGFEVGGEEGEGETVLAGALRSDWERLSFKTGGVGTGLTAGGETVLPSPVDAVDEITPAIAAQVRRTPSITYTGASSGDYHDPVTVSASLVDPTFSPASAIAGVSIAFKLGPSASDSCTATTDASGIASCAITPTQSAANYNVVATFAGNQTYQPVSDTQTFTITPEETTLSYTGPGFILAGPSSVTLTANLVEDGSADNDGDGGSRAPVPSESVRLVMGTQSCSGTTDAAGNVSCTIPGVTAPPGPTTIEAVFAGDSYYGASAASTTAIVYLPLKPGTTSCDTFYGGSGTRVIVPSGAVCTLIPGTRVSHDVLVRRGGTLVDLGAAIGRDLIAVQPRGVAITGGKVGDDVVIQHPTNVSPSFENPSGENYVCGLSVGHDVIVRNGTAGAGLIDIGDPPHCAAGNLVGHDVLVQNNAGPVEVSDNGTVSSPIGHNLIVQSNRPGGATVSDNNAAHDAICKRNSPQVGKGIHAGHHNYGCPG